MLLRFFVTFMWFVFHPWLALLISIYVDLSLLCVYILGMIQACCIVENRYTRGNHKIKFQISIKKKEKKSQRGSRWLLLTVHYSDMNNTEQNDKDPFLDFGSSLWLIDLTNSWVLFFPLPILLEQAEVREGYFLSKAVFMAAVGLSPCRWLRFLSAIFRVSFFLLSFFYSFYLARFLLRGSLCESNTTLL